jgi:hypothetical protein
VHAQLAHVGEGHGVGRGAVVPLGPCRNRIWTPADRPSHYLTGVGSECCVCEALRSTLTKALPAIQATLKTAGIEFLNGDGAGVKLKAKDERGKRP